MSRSRHFRIWYRNADTTIFQLVQARPRGSVQRSNEPVTSTPFQQPKRGRRPRVLVVEEPGEGVWGAQQYLLRLAPLLEVRGYDQILAAPESSAVARHGASRAVRTCIFPSRRYGRYGDTATRGPCRPRSPASWPDGGQRPPHRHPGPRCRSTASTPTPTCRTWRRPWAAESPACRWSCTCMKSSRRVSPNGCAPRRSGSPTRRCPSAGPWRTVCPSRPGTGSRSSRTASTRWRWPLTGGPGRPAGAGGRPDRTGGALPESPGPPQGRRPPRPRPAALPGEQARTQLAIVGATNLDPPFMAHLRALAAELLGPRVRFWPPEGHRRAAPGGRRVRAIPAKASCSSSWRPRLADPGGRLPGLGDDTGGRPRRRDRCSPARTTWRTSPPVSAGSSPTPTCAPIWPAARAQVISDFTLERRPTGRPGSWTTWSPAVGATVAFDQVGDAAGVHRMTGGSRRLRSGAGATGAPRPAAGRGLLRGLRTPPTGTRWRCCSTAVSPR